MIWYDMIIWLDVWFSFLILIGKKWHGIKITYGIIKI